jgi:peptidoglycan/LPS O-acetylase OafA/YrhL
MTFALTGAIFVHSAAVANPGLGFVAGFISAWGIPVLFLMAGAGTAFALKRRSGSEYLRERLLRLGVPLLVIMLFFAPLQAYFILLSNPSLVSMSTQLGFVPISDPEQLRSITGFYTVYLTFIITSVRQLSPLVSNLIFGGLFFVPRLLVVSFICLPLLLYLHGKGQRWVERIAAVGAHPLMLLIGAGLVPGVVMAILRSGWLERFTAGWPYTDDWSAFFLGLAMFVYGYLIYASVRLRTAVRDVAWYAVVLGAVCTSTVVAVMMLNRVPPNDASPASMAYAIGQAFAAWLPALALLGIAMRYLTMSNRLLAYLTPAAFPVFLLHTPVQAAVTYYILQMPVYWVIQLVAILIVTFALAFAIYEYVLRRTPVTRFLFGIKSPRTKSRVQSRPPATNPPREAVPTA